MMVQEDGKKMLICKNRKYSVLLDGNFNVYCQATAQSSGYIMSNKFRRVNFPKVTLLRVSLVCRIIITKISLLQYLNRNKKFFTVVKH